MKEIKFGDSTGNGALSHLRADRAVLAHRINEIAGRMGQLKTELKMLTEEMQAKVEQLDELNHGIRMLGTGNINSTHRNVPWI